VYGGPYADVHHPDHLVIPGMRHADPRVQYAARARLRAHGTGGATWCNPPAPPSPSTTPGRASPPTPYHTVCSSSAAYTSQATQDAGGRGTSNDGR